MTHVKLKDPGYCKECGTRLHFKHLANEGEIPYCDSCKEYRFPMFNAAISTIVYNPDKTKIALIQQYGRDWNILVAGYLTIGESAEEALKREVNEELGLNVVEYHFNSSEYFEPSNTLMINFACVVDSDELTHTNEEIDRIAWYTPDEARESILHDSLAEDFLLRWLDRDTGA